ncbi:SIS domain-containing protein [Paenibacillus lutimineralis]|uniref:SIS domain-containing protein n=1 Tax=Paenibacillus lutimineralis TaxID=2707005 RepID=A0A3S9UVC0_9BACL|nr:SIS domain-containing protein [Paenibacillus lutimineralis]AZS14309.1 SIS domain-containing protein [Paenibacillus lutimineralis]
MNRNFLKNNSSVMREEIFEQPQLLRESLETNKEMIKTVSADVKDRGCRSVYFTARGSSEHACLLAQYIMEIYGGIPSKIVNPSVITLYHGNLDMSGSVTIGVSQSGGAEDVSMVLGHARNQGALTISLTNIQGVVDKAAEHNMHNHVGNERAMPATKTYMSQALLLTKIMAEITGSAVLRNAVDNVPDAIAAALAHENLIREYASYFRYANSIDIFSRGITHAAMKEAELKIQETANVSARAYAASDYSHGPFSTTSHMRPCIFTLVDSVTDDFTMNLYRNMLKKDIFAMAITNKPELAKEFPLAIVLPENCEGICGAFSAVTVMQLFSCWLAIYRGINPDKPEGVSKTVVTI